MKINLKKQKGGMILEMILMVSVLALILPMIQRQTKKQLELSENILVVKELLKYRLSMENFINEYEADILSNLDAEKGSICSFTLKDLPNNNGKCGSFITKQNLEKHGIYQVNTPNILGKEYSIFIRRDNASTDNLNKDSNIEVLILGLGANKVCTGSKCLKKGISIFKELGSSGIYSDGSQIQGFGWSATHGEWDNPGLVAGDVGVYVSTRSQGGDYISKIDENVADFNLMGANLYLSANNITSVNNFYSKVVNAKSFTGTSSTASRVIVSGNSEDTNGNSINITNNIYAEKVSFPMYETSDVLTLTTNSSYPTVSGSMFFYGTFKGESITAKDVRSEKIYTSRLNSDSTSLVINVKDKIESKNLAVNDITAHMMYGRDLIFLGANIIKNGDSSDYYLKFATNEHSFKKLVIVKIGEKLNNMNLMYGAIPKQSSLKEVFEALEKANADFRSEILSVSF